MYSYGSYWHNPRRTSRPAHVTAPNGLNFVRSEGNPNSRLERVKAYLRTNGPSTKRAILHDVFGKVNPDSTTVRGWGSQLFQYATIQGHLTHERKGKTVLWSVNR